MSPTVSQRSGGERVGVDDDLFYPNVLFRLALLARHRYLLQRVQDLDAVNDLPKQDSTKVQNR